MRFQEKQGDISEDDTVRFKSYLMSLGIDDPVTRDTFRSDSEYYMGLATQISDMMVAVLLVRTYLATTGLTHSATMGPNSKLHLAYQKSVLVLLPICCITTVQLTCTVDST